MFRTSPDLGHFNGHRVQTYSQQEGTAICAGNFIIAYRTTFTASADRRHPQRQGASLHPTGQSSESSFCTMATTFWASIIAHLAAYELGPLVPRVGSCWEDRMSAPQCHGQGQTREGYPYYTSRLIPDRPDRLAQYPRPQVQSCDKT